MHEYQDRDQTLVIEDGDAIQQGVDQILTIQQVAQETGLSVHALRYYERAGLMQAVRRNETNGYRTYTRQNLGWIEFIKRLRATGMPIRDIQRYAGLILQGEQTVADRMHLLREHRSRIEAHLLEVEHHLAAISAKIAYYEQAADQCQSATCERRPTENET